MNIKSSYVKKKKSNKKKMGRREKKEGRSLKGVDQSEKKGEPGKGNLTRSAVAQKPLGLAGFN
jgi:hypothetical protein